MEPWQQQEGESGQAFLAFQTYLELGPKRSYDEAFRRAHPGRDKGARAPGTWRGWAKTHRWAERARAYDERNAKIEDETTVTTLRQVIGDKTAADWEAGRIQRRQAHERAEWEFRELLLSKAKLMLNFGLSQRVVKQAGTNGEVQLHVYEPVKWNMGDAINAVKLASLLGRMANEMPIKPPDQTPPDPNVPEEVFWEHAGDAAERLPDGVMPSMPVNPAVKPQLDHTLQKAQAGDLIQPGLGGRPK